MLHNFFNRSPAPETAILKLSAPPPLNLNFDSFNKGIDNVHIDVRLSPRFINNTDNLIRGLLIERTTDKRRTTDKPSEELAQKLEKFQSSYAAMLTAAIHRAQNDKKISMVQLYQITVIKYLLHTVKQKADQLLQELRNDMLIHGNTTNGLALYERTVWINQNYNTLLHKILSDLFNHIHRIEIGEIKPLRQILLGVDNTLPEEILQNQTLRSFDTADYELLMNYYLFLPQDPDSRYNFNNISKLLNNVLEKITKELHITTPETKKPDEISLEKQLTWHDSPANMDALFNTEETLHTLECNPTEELKQKLKLQRKAIHLLEQDINEIILNILAAYEMARLYKYYARLLKPHLIYQTLCGFINIQEVQGKLQAELKIRPLKRQQEQAISINELITTQKNIRRLAKQTDHSLLLRFMKDFISYRRDLKYCRLLQQSMDLLNVLHNDAEIQLSRTNGMLYEFLEQDEYDTPTAIIKSHTILKADVRGSTTITAELCKQGLNPATHFSLNFFNPIRQLLEEFGAEKVFIEGDAVILSLFEYNNESKQYFPVARACGLAQQILTVVDAQNQICRSRNLPILELGIGVCFISEAPAFLYDGDQRIMISPAIGDADRLSSCSWKLRQKLAYQNTVKRVQVFKQKVSDFTRGEKGMDTIRYNLNGIEIDAASFNKLRNEINLRNTTLRLPNDTQSNCFYYGSYPNVRGELLDVIIREGKISFWQDDGGDLLPTHEVYYEVVADKTLFNAVKKVFLANSG